MTKSVWTECSIADLATDDANAVCIGPFGSDLLASDLVGEGVPVVFVKNVRPGRFDPKGLRYVTSEKAEQLRSHRVRAGDIVITKMGLPPCIAAPYPKGSPDGIVTADIIKMTPDPTRAEARYLVHFLNSELARAQVAQFTFGVTRPKVTLKDFRRLRLQLPPLPEQRRIADILDKADAIRRKRKEAIALTEELLRSAFLEMFGDPVTNPRCLDKRSLGSLIAVKSGDFLPAKAMGVGGKFPVYGGNGINGRHTEFMFAESKIVIGRVGLYCGVVHRTEPESWITDNALYVAEMDHALLPTYLEYALRFADLNKYASQSAQPLISGGRIYPVKILVPPIQTQHRFENAERAQRRLRTHAGEGVQMGNALFDALVHLAFRGQPPDANGAGKPQLRPVDTGGR